MAAIDEVTHRGRAPAFYLWVAGLDVLYGSVTPPTRTAYGATSYTKVVGIIPGRGMSTTRRLDEVRGVSQAQPVQVHLRSDQADTDASASDPGVVFGRLGPQAATASAKVLTAIERDTALPLAVTLDTDLSGLSYPRMVHIGRETFWATAAAGGGTPTITLSLRAQMGTPYRRHPVDTDTGLTPDLTTEIVYWRGRRAIIYEAAVLGDGSTSTWVERWRGFIEREPEFGRDGEVIVSVAPLTSLLDVELGRFTKATRMSQSYHVFSDGVGTKVEHVQWINDGDGYAEFMTAATAALSLKLDAPTGVFDQAFDITLPSGHPRHGRLKATAGNVISMEPVNPHNSGAQFLLSAADPSRNMVLGELITNTGSIECKTAEVADTSSGAVVKRWPDALATAINSAWRTGSYTGATGAWADVGISLDGEEGPTLRVTANAQPSPGPIFVAFSDSPADDLGLERPYGATGVFQSATPNEWDASGLVGPRPVLPVRLSPVAFSYADPTDAAGQRVAQAQFQGQGRRSGAFTQPEGVRLVALNTLDDAAVFVPLPHVALSFHQAGEKYLTVEDAIGIPSGGTMTVAIYAGDAGESELIGIVEVIAETAITDPVTAAAAGYRLELAERHYDGGPDTLQDFAEYPGSPRISIVPSMLTGQGNRAGIILADLLCSDGGHFITDAVHDILPFGAGLSTDASGHAGADLDKASLLAIQDPSAHMTWAPRYKQGTTIRELVGGILLTTGYVLDMRVNDAGLCRLTAIRTGLPSEGDRLGTLTTSDIAAVPRPSTEVERDIRNVFKFKCNYGLGPDGEPDEPGLIRVVHVDTSEEVFDEPRSLDLDMQGLILDPSVVDFHDTLRALWGRLAVQLAFPRRVWRFDVRSGAAVQMQLGGTYGVTHPLLRGTSGVGVTDALVRVRSVSEDWWRATSQVEVTFYGYSGAGWNVGARVTSAPTATSVIVADNRYSTTFNRITGAAQLDVDFFDGLVGEIVDAYPGGDMDAFVQLEILSVDRATRRINFNPAGVNAGLHGLITPDWGDIGATVYASAPGAHQVRAYIGRITIT